MVRGTVAAVLCRSWFCLQIFFQIISLYIVTAVFTGFTQILFIQILKINIDNSHFYIVFFSIYIFVHFCTFRSLRYVAGFPRGSPFSGTVYEFVYFLCSRLVMFMERAVVFLCFPCVFMLLKPYLCL